MKTKIAISPVESFCKRHEVSEDQFYGKETIAGSLYLGSLTSIPEGFNPTVGGSLYLGSLTSIPEGFNPTVGGDLVWNNRRNRKYVGASVLDVRKTIELSWQDGKYTKVDGIFCEVISAHFINNNISVIRAKKVNRDEFFFIAKKDGFSAHGQTLQSAVDDLNFKVIAEKLKKEPIQKDTEITVQYYRTLTGACDFGCRDFMQRNNLPFIVEDGKTKEVAPIKAGELLPLLEKSGAYGLDAFRKLITW